MKLMPLLILLTLAYSARAQEKGSFYVFNAEWKPTKIDSALFFLHVHQVNDSCWQWDYYNFRGPMLKMEQYRDKDAKELNGVCHYYNEKGWLDSTTMYRRGKKNGDSYKLSGDSFSIKMKYVYQDDSLVTCIDVSKKKNDTAVKYKDEKESEYPGGLGQWARYLNKHLKYPERALNWEVEGDVRVFFIVDAAGKTLDPYIAKSIEYSLDEESLKIIRESGKWEPAFQNGRYVKSYKVQPIFFRLK